MASGTAQGTLPWSWYSDPEVLQRERERIFGHGWQYAGPAEQSPSPSGKTERWGRLVFANADAEAPPLAETLGPVPGRVAAAGIDVDSLRFRRRCEFELACNWKIAVENYLECYHCSVAHPGFSAVVDVSPDAYRLETQRAARPAQPRRRAGDTARPRALVRVAQLLLPRGGLRRRGGRAPRLRRSDGLEDRSLVESVQAGVSSGLLEGGRLLPESERLLAHFQGLVREALA